MNIEYRILNIKQQVIDSVRDELAGIYPEKEIDSLVRILFRHYVKSSLPIFLYDIEISAEEEMQIFAAIEELKKYRPIQYILGETEFYGLPVEVNSGVLIPRPETEELADHIVRMYDKNAALSIVDIGTGSGCIAVALKVNFPNATVWGLDVSEQALLVAERNASKNGVAINYLLRDALKGDMMGFERETLDVVVSNPPYVTPSDALQMHANVLEYEPHIALFTPENEPLIFFTHIASFAEKSLRNGGRIFFEINEAFHEEVAYILQQHNFSDILPQRDINGKWRMIFGKK